MRIRELLVSVAQSFPVSAAMMLETGGAVTSDGDGAAEEAFAAVQAAEA